MPARDEVEGEMEDREEEVGSTEDFLWSSGLALCGAEDTMMVRFGAVGLPAGNTFRVLTTILLVGFGLSLDEGSGDDENFDPKGDFESSFVGGAEELTFLDPTGLLFGEGEEAVLEDVTVTFLVTTGLRLAPVDVTPAAAVTADFAGLFLPAGGVLLTLRVERGLDLGE